MLQSPGPASRPASLDVPASSGDATPPATRPAEPPSETPATPGLQPAAGVRAAAALPSIWWIRGPVGLAIALALPLAVAAVARSTSAEIAPTMGGLFIIAVIITASVGGIAPGLVATAISLPLAAYWVLPPIGTFAIEAPEAIRLVSLTVLSSLASVLAGALAIARARSDRAADEAERLNAELRERAHELQRERAESRAHADRLARATGEYEIVTRALSGARDAADAERRRIARLLESVTDGFCTVDANGRVTFANDALLAMWRRGAPEVMGRALAELLPSSGSAELRDGLARTLRDRAPAEGKYHDATLDSHFDVKAVPFDDGASVVLRDITARVRAEEELRASEARYRALSEAGTRLVWSATASGQVEEMPVWSALTGQGAAEVRGEGWMEAIHADDRARVLAAWRRAVAARETFHGEFRVRLRDGEHRWHRARAVPVLDAAGAVNEWVGVLENSDAEHRTEEARRFLERASEALAASLDVRSTLHTVVRLAVDGSPPFADTARVDLPGDAGGFDCLAFESRDAEIARAYRELEAEHPVPNDAPAGFPRVIATGDSELIERFDADLLPRIAGTVPPHAAMLVRMGMYSGLCVPLRARGETLGALTLVLHAPERRRPYDRRDLAVAEELGRRAGLALDNALRYEAAEQARREAEQANRAKADFLAVMSHELRTPLNAISGYAELLLLELRGSLTPEQREDITRIQRSQQHLLALVNDVLNFAKLDAGRVELDIAAVPLASVLEGLDALVAPQMTQKQLAYAVAIDAEAEAAVRADAEKLRQVLLNLLSNAVKATAPGGRITLRCCCDGPHVLLTVEDTGHGIPANKLERVFEPFVQLERRLSSNHEGMGLGLAISRELTRAMRGDLTVQSEVGVGSRFTVALPRA